VHAALADPARLRIVDALGIGDASPTDLRELVGMPSNLLAHHLRTLEATGLLVRHRSEADRRRSYLQLVPAALDGLLPRGVVAVPRVVFVCTANSARSRIAAALWERASTVPSTSAGTHPADRVAAGAVAVARRHRLRLGPGRPRLLDDVLHPDDFVVTVCDNAHEELARDGQRPGRRQHWSVPDPVRVGTDDAFDRAYDDLARRVTRLAPLLAS
jgi:protein-tyrosine-phosphatase/DNA-binding transcriptional ArsR family regulator